MLRRLVFAPKSTYKFEQYLRGEKQPRSIAIPFSSLTIKPSNHQTIQLSLLYMLWRLVFAPKSTYKFEQYLRGEKQPRSIAIIHHQTHLPTILLSDHPPIKPSNSLQSLYMLRRLVFAPKSTCKFEQYLRGEKQPRSIAIIHHQTNLPTILLSDHPPIKPSTI